MKSIYLFWLFALCMITACKETPTTQQEPQKSQDASDVVNPGASKISGGHDYTFLTEKMFHYKASSTIGKDPSEQPYAGQWIDFDPDGTYKAGKLSDQTHTGRWDYNHDKGIILIRPDDPKFKGGEWKVMHNEDMVVLIGTTTYGNNGTQIQLVRRDNFPQ